MNTTINDWSYRAEGLIWKNITIQVIDNTPKGYLLDAQPSWIESKVIDLSHHTTLESAIASLVEIDSMTHDELTMYGEEG